VRRLPLVGLKVLLVEDHAPTREGLSRLLSGAGAEVSAWGDARGAVASVVQRRPDVIVSDLALPEGDGFAFLREVRALGGAAAVIPAIALTAHARTEDATRALAAGFQLHLAKPAGSQELIDAILRVAGRGARAREARRTRRSWPG
jgi:CheY-like chemotaxis protein